MRGSRFSKHGFFLLVNSHDLEIPISGGVVLRVPWTRRGQVRLVYLEATETQE